MRPAARGAGRGLRGARRSAVLRRGDTRRRRAMGEKSTFLGALVESRRFVREAAARAKDAVDPGLKAVRDTAEKIRSQIVHHYPPRVDRTARTVESDHCIYEVREKERGS